MWTASNKIIQHLIETGQIKPKGLQHYGGKHYFYVTDDGHFGGNINCEELGKIITWMRNEEIELILIKLRKEKIEKIKNGH